MSKRTPVIWTSNLKDAKAKKEFLESLPFVLRGPIAERLKEILEMEMKAADKPPSIQDYESEAWSHKQAHLNGKREAYNRILSLLTL